MTLKETHVRTAEQAMRLAFVSSPTVRLNGRDAALGLKESACSDCGDLCGDDTTCRVWTWRGKDYAVPPQAMLLDAILRDAYLHASGDKQTPAPLRELPENLRRFFEGVRRP